MANPEQGQSLESNGSYPHVPGPRHPEGEEVDAKAVAGDDKLQGSSDTMRSNLSISVFDSRLSQAAREGMLGAVRKLIDDPPWESEDGADSSTEVK